MTYEMLVSGGSTGLETKRLHALHCALKRCLSCIVNQSGKIAAVDIAATFPIHRLCGFVYSGTTSITSTVLYNSVSPPSFIFLECILFSFPLLFQSSPPLFSSFYVNVLTNTPVSLRYDTFNWCLCQRKNEHAAATSR